MHVAGTIYRPSQPGPIACTQDQSEASLYLREVARFLTRPLPPEVKEALPFDSFCFNLSSASSDQVNAAADPDRREIEVFPGVLKHAENDADVAAVLAHELSHILLAHGDKTRRHPLLEADPTYLALAAAIDPRFAADCGKLFYFKLSFASEALRSSRQESDLRLDLLASDITHSVMDSRLLTADDHAHFCSYGLAVLARLDQAIEEAPEKFKRDSRDFEEWTRHRASLRALLDAPEAREQLLRLAAFERYTDDTIGYGPYAGISWREQEADELGYEIYLKAGFKAERYGWEKLYLLQHASPEAHDYENCHTLLAAGEIPDRGAGIHPTLCYRVYNAEVREPARHAAEPEFKTLLESNETLDLAGVSLKDILIRLKRD